jgi:hypothetical protein
MKALLRIGQWAIFRTFDGQQSQEETRFASRAVASASRNNSAPRRDARREPAMPRLRAPS